MKTKEQKRKEARERQARYDATPLDEKLAAAKGWDRKRLMLRKLMARHLGAETLNALYGNGVD